jgi:hypothetical protein
MSKGKFITVVDMRASVNATLEEVSVDWNIFLTADLSQHLFTPAHDKKNLGK